MNIISQKDVYMIICNKNSAFIKKFIIDPFKKFELNKSYKEISNDKYI